MKPDLPGLGVTMPFDKKAATVGNGVMVALMVDSTTKVDALHRKALQLGAKDEGAPGRRSETSTPATFAIWTATSSTSFSAARR